MNTSTASSQWTGSGYIGVYSPYWTTRQEKVTDAKGNVLVFHDQFKAECHAWRALKAAEDRIEALRLEPGQIKLPAKPKSWSGRRAAAEAVFKERAEA